MTQPTVTSTDVDVGTSTSSLTAVHWAALALAAITGAIHLYLYTTEQWLPFLAAGAGFIGAIGVFFLLRNYRRYLYLIGIPYTVAQIGGYLLFPMGAIELSVIDKVVQIAFIVALGYLYLSERKQAMLRDFAAE